MNVAPIAATPANENSSAVHLALTITDPLVAHELVQRPEGHERDGYAKEALRLGVIAIRQASGAIDAATIQREAERMLRNVRELLAERTATATDGIAKVLGCYFDPTSGSLPQRLESLTRRDGELETLLTKHLDGDRSVIAQTLAKHVGEQSPLFRLLSPNQTDGLVAVLTKTFDTTLKAQSDCILQQFSLDRADSALQRLLTQVTDRNGKLRDELAQNVQAVTQQFSLDHEGSALNRLRSAIDSTSAAVRANLTLDDQDSSLSRLRAELRGVLDGLTTSNAQFQTEVRATLEGFKARREEAARSPRHGHSFEASVGEFLFGEAQRLNDIYEAVGTLKGRADRKTGDHVLTLSEDSGAPNARIVCEAKAKKGYSEKSALEEIALARKNRDAQVGLVVMDRATAPDAVNALRRIGQDVLVVWDAEDPASDLNLRLAVSVARALCVRQSVADSQTAASLVQLDESIQAIANQIGVVEEIITCGRTIKTRGEKVTQSAEKLRDTLEREVEALQDHVKALRKEAK
jgi:hypothetical protein